MSACFLLSATVMAYNTVTLPQLMDWSKFSMLLNRKAADTVPWLLAFLSLKYPERQDHSQSTERKFALGRENRRERSEMSGRRLFPACLGTDTSIY